MRRRAALGFLGIAIVVGCQLPQQQAQQPPAPQQPYPYYPPQPYPPPQPYYPPQPYPSYAPTQTAPAPLPPAPPPQPAPAPTTPPAPAPSTPTNPWANLLQGLLQGGAPPLPQWPLPWPQPLPQPSSPTIDARGLDLANAINAYRIQNGLAAIPISKALSKVGDTHVHDLASTPPMAAQCNDHSWSNRGKWTACCYTPDNAQASCMWYKPSEVAGFNATGYEISIGQPGVIQPGVTLDSKQAIAFWSQSQLHNDVMLNHGQWASMTWKAMGAGIIDSHASAWFSDTADPTP